eukprot:CAMPEP_0195034188 /NCGR_PEP_ID=MMETSP0326_2-20130528/67342_1 /TAXON_ID=2866 ORGANISM="Crypthecodinium cohnii, Strain Seligo" /NCGR_SAMPLE_ID=MMETSP0326_2 /ASSEMBLY_ACC=CAM_ASM_000348 /LENGTH=41 /DNA_ID= /DNA_START= /DNA_END= /DNA_ORIENTATION=
MVPRRPRLENPSLCSTADSPPANSSMIKFKVAKDCLATRTV